MRISPVARPAERSHLGGVGQSGYGGKFPPVTAGKQVTCAEQIDFVTTGYEGSGSGGRSGTVTGIHRSPSSRNTPCFAALNTAACHLKRMRQRILHR